MTDCTADIAIVGRGIAGSAAALTLAGSGLSVTAIAPAVAPRMAVGDSLAPAANALLRALGLDEAFAAGPHRSANATYAAWGTDLLAERNAIVHTEGPGHVIDRAAFEQMLSDAVSRTPTTRLNNAVSDAARDGDGVALTLADGGRLYARFVLDCSGRRAIVARRLATRRRRADRLTAAYAFLSQHDTNIEPTPATMIEAAPEGWWYAALLPDRRISLALFSDPDRLPRGISRDAVLWRERIDATHYVRRWLDSAGFSADAPPHLTSAGTAWLEPAVGDAWAAAGDAAVSFDPLSSHGITSALWAGQRAAHAARTALQGDGAPLARYAATIEHAVQNFLMQRRAVYAQERRFADHPFWRRRIISTREFN